ncbi:hypothetical protein E1262_15585 [Jiangella aurantiaca]|uniref:Type I restriction modification DNA specificity domain-containing protein n=1 Tax=Jiangella aurantiaca TaxID=2530373 RepID=A0A4R5ABA7_9ACTN|nr:restriction endonuclease subunit S [Jiangella aurantiaca]TDD68446.1 hypothetical protein E1262_15585 [Jiangella aurantiaca]
MSPWPIVTLDDVKAPGPGSITDGPFGSNLKSSHYVEDGPQVVRLQNIGDGVYVDSPAHITWEHFENLRKHEVVSGDLVVASLGEALPRACLMPAHVGPAIVKADCIRVRLSDSVDPRWVLYALQRPEARQWAEGLLHGLGRPRLGLKNIRAIPIPLPDLPEQRRIVEVLEDHLSRLDAGIRNAQLAGRRLSSLRQAWRQAVLDAVRANDVSLADLVDRVEAGKSFGGSAPSAGPDEWGIIKVSAMTWGEFRPEENKRIPAEKADPRYEVKAGDLLVSRANTAAYVGASVLVRETRPRLLLSDKSLRLVPKAGVSAAWLHEVLQSPRSRRQISGIATGTKDSMRNISQKALLSIKVPGIVSDQQSEVVASFSRAAESISALESSLEHTVRRSAWLRRALLTAAFSGRLTATTFDVDREELMEVMA